MPSHKQHERRAAALARAKARQELNRRIARKHTAALRRKALVLSGKMGKARAEQVLHGASEIYWYLRALRKIGKPLPRPYADLGDDKLFAAIKADLLTAERVRCGCRGPHNGGQTQQTARAAAAARSPGAGTRCGTDGTSLDRRSTAAPRVLRKPGPPKGTYPGGMTAPAGKVAVPPPSNCEIRQLPTQPPAEPPPYLRPSGLTDPREKGGTEAENKWSALLRSYNAAALGARTAR
jgi:hypothetical protein